MIRIYLDWNVMSQMKGGFHKDLLIVLASTDRFLIPYSTSHIGDILSSISEDIKQKARIDDDLNFISEITNGAFLFNTGKHVKLDFADPKDYFEQRTKDEDFLDGFDLDKIEELFKSEGFSEIGKSLVKMIKSIPIDDALKTALENPESRETLNKIFPDLTDNPTMEGFFRSFGKMFKNFNETEDFKTLREITQSGLGINRDKLFDSDDPFGNIESIHKNFGFKWDEYIDHSKHAPEWFNKITNAYLELDMHGYQEDKIEVKPKKRKQTFANITEDGFHAAFATTCHFYIINDNRSFKKTKKVYEQLNINTVVCKPQEFIDYYRKYIDLNIKSVGNYIRIVADILKTSDFIETNVENGIRRTFPSPYFLFDFFNKVVLQRENESEESILVLGRIMPTNFSSTFVFEVTNLVDRINTLFGIDIENSDRIDEDELRAENWAGISWQADDGELRLLAINGHVQMYLNFNTMK